MLDAPTLWQLADARANETPDQEMLVDADGRRLTCAGFAAEVERMAGGLARAGVRRGDVVAWELPTWIETLVLAAALSRLGAVQVPIIAIYRDREVVHCCAQAGARLLVTPRTFRGYDYEAMGVRVAAAVPGLAPLVVGPDEFPGGDDPPPPVAGGGVRWICYTSGTTSVPKGARHTDEALAAVAGAMARRLQVVAGDRYALVFPFPHVGGIILLFMTLRTGCTSLLDAAFDPGTTIAFLARGGVTHAGTGTPFHLAYLAAQRQQPHVPLFDRLKCCPGGGAPKPATIHHEVKRELGGAGVVSGWGLTEAPILTLGGLDDPDEKLAGTEGRPLPGVDVRVVDGELQVRGPQVMKGYVDADLDGDAFVDGWLCTGDLGFVDDDGYVVIDGRLKDVIVRRGENVSAKEVEDLLFRHPSVADVAVVGLADDRTGERVCAVVATQPGAPPPRLTDVRDHLLALGLRVQAVPEQLEVVDALPRNPAGKVLKEDLRRRYQAT